MKTVIKRDGSRVKFDRTKITKAVLKAFEEVHPGNYDSNLERSEDICVEVCRKIETFTEFNIENIQDVIEKELMDKDKEVAKAYITYRYKRAMARDEYEELMNDVREKLSAENVQNQNANLDEKSFGGRIGEATDLVMKRYALNYCMSEMAKRNHLNNEIYIHDLSHYAVGDHNCYLRSTRFITNEGIKSFNDYNDGDEVTILTKDGKWKTAIVHFYGRQPMFEITLSRCGISKTVVATRNHRWLLSDGTFTDNIQIGDTIYPLHNMEAIEITSQRQSQMFALGFILGDGYDHHDFWEAKFCTSDKENYIPIFIKAGYHIGISNNYKYARKKCLISKQEFLNKRMWNILSFEDKRCLFEGYLAADGSKTTNTKYVWTSDERICQLIEDISAIDGYHIFKKRTITNDTEYKKSRTLYEYTFTQSYNNNTTWKVIDIKKGEHKNSTYEAWCLEEPQTHTFTLEGGIVTGNCLSIPFDDLLANGFNTRQTDVRPAQSVSTAFQLVAVIFQLQSLQQFGGVSATHLDWTMVPYVRKSFSKHFKDGLKYCCCVNQEYIDSVPKELSFDDNEANDIYNKKAYEYAMDMTIKEVYQAVEGMYHNLNTLQSRSGNQLPFTSINYGTCTLPEGRLITKALLDVSISGIGKLHKTSIFPCGIFQCMKGVNRKEGDPNYDLYRLALKSTALRLYPNYANVDWSGNAGYDPSDPKTYFSTMGMC